MNILVLNGGSSSLKGMLWEVSGPELPLDAPSPVWAARVDWGRHPGSADVRLTFAGPGAGERQIAITKPVDVLQPVLSTLPRGVDVVGHRVVHGGRAFRDPARIDAKVRDTIARLAQLAPEHNRLELETIEAAEHALGSGVPQIAVFDTAFHARMPAAAVVYPGPYGWFEEGIRRFGFHGISHQYVSQRTARILGRPLESLRLITCHLGNGCSLAAVVEGRGVDTTMGFTPLEGLMMGTRSGSVDPGILIHLLRHRGYSADQLDHILNQESGLKGVSGVSADMREVLAAAGSGNERARLAFDVFAHRVARGIGSMLASAGRPDALVFTAGIGENCPPLREVVCRRLGFLGLKLDAAKNQSSPVDQDIAEADSSVRVLVVHTNEDWQIARECYRYMQMQLTAEIAENAETENAI